MSIKGMIPVSLVALLAIGYSILGVHRAHAQTTRTQFPSACSVPKEWGKYVGTTPTAILPMGVANEKWQDFAIAFEDEAGTLRFVSSNECWEDGKLVTAFTVKRE